MHHMARSSIDEQHIPDAFKANTLCGFELSEVTIEQLSKHLSARDFTSIQLTDFCLRRILALNPYLEAVIETNPDALSIAEQLHRERLAGSIRGPLHGIPVLVKDNMATHDAMQTTAGSWALLGSVVAQDATVVALLRKAGAIILGHTNMCEWASIRSKEASVGYSARGGQCRNPYDLSKSPHGSSSGSAVAVAANMVPLALGTETDTSIIGPASLNGVVGIKPTVGLTSRAGVIPISANMDSVGTFGRTVADAVIGLDIIAGADPLDPFTLTSRPHSQGPLTQHLATSSALKGARFGLPLARCWDLVEPSHKALATQLFSAMTAAGAQIIDVDLPSITERVAPSGEWNWEHGAPNKSEWTVGKIDAYNGITAYLQSLTTSPIRSIDDIIASNIASNGSEGASPGLHPAFPSGQDRLLEIAASRGIKDATYHAALAHIHTQTRENGLDAALNGGVDALLFCDRKMIGQQYAAQAGYPIICIPIGLDDGGMPVSLSIQHTAWREAELVRWASAIEDLWRGQRGPRAVPGWRRWWAKNVPVEEG